MHIRLLIPVLILALASPARAVTLDEVRKTLAGLGGASPMNAKIDYSQRKTSDGATSDSSGSFVAEDDGTTLRLVQSKAELRRRIDAGLKSDSAVGPSEVIELMNHAPALIKSLKGATVKRVVATTLEGSPATLIEVVPLPEPSERSAKFVKSFSDVLQLWIGADGTPLAAERTTKLKARFLMVSFETSLRERRRFVRSGDHLVVTRSIVELSTAGLGQDEQVTRSATVTVLR